MRLTDRGCCVARAMLLLLLLLATQEAHRRAEKLQQEAHDRAERATKEANERVKDNLENRANAPVKVLLRRCLFRSSPPLCFDFLETALSFVLRRSTHQHDQICDRIDLTLNKKSQNRARQTVFLKNDLMLVCKRFIFCVLHCFFSLRTASTARAQSSSA